ncbi:MAG: transglutaminase domain-containing protein [Planctomycetaceae bacterium]|nr:transglutaminase domain-containing protein [Planctomycetaceae bacterium]
MRAFFPFNPLRWQDFFRITIAATLAVNFLPRAGCSPVAAAVTKGDDRWYVVLFDEQPVGYERVQCRNPMSNAAVVPSDTQPLGIDEASRGTTGRNGGTIRDEIRWECFRRTEIKLRRMGQDLSLKATLRVQQTTGGELLSFHLQRTDGEGNRIEREGALQPNGTQFSIREKVFAARREYEQSVPAHCFSPIVSSWVGRLMRSEERRQILPVFFPETVSASDLRFDHHQPRQIRLRDGRALKASRITMAPEADLTNVTTFFLDSAGEVLRQEKRLLGGTLAIEACDAEAGLSAVAGKSLDLDAAAPIPVDRLISVRAGQQQIVVDLVNRNGLPVIIPSTRTQQVEVIDAVTTRITIAYGQTEAARTDAGGKDRAVEIRESQWMPLNSAEIMQLATIAGGGQSGKIDVCHRMERFLSSKMQRAALSPSILPAPEVARTMRGDCTEHAVLLAAMMRVKQIPARLAGGLIYNPQSFGFVGHAWVEAWVDGHWESFDSTVPANARRPVYIKLCDTDLTEDGSNGLSLFLPVLSLTGDAEIHVVAD